MRLALTILLALLCLLCQGQDTAFLKVHFLYGSKPLKKYKETEPKWFGGIWGGHVGVEGDSGRIVNFVPQGKFLWFAKRTDKHSRYAIHSPDGFYAILGGDPDSVRKAIAYIPVSGIQQKKFDSLTTAYLAQTPYDYAFFGMRCGAAAYDLLAKSGVLPEYSYTRTYRKIFYPKKLRKRLLGMARQNGWTIVRQDGSEKRKWERD